MRATTTNYYKLRGLNNSNALPRSSGSYKAEIKTVVVLSEGSEGRTFSGPLFPWLAAGHLFPTSLPIVFPVCMSVSVAQFPLYLRTPVLLDDGTP